MFREPALNAAAALIPGSRHPLCSEESCIALVWQQDLFMFFCSAPRGDWLLGFVYRTSSVQLNVAGLQPVDLDDRRMVNMDLSAVVSSTS